MERVKVPCLTDQKMCQPLLHHYRELILRERVLRTKYISYSSSTSGNMSCKLRESIVGIPLGDLGQTDSIFVCLKYSVMIYVDTLLNPHDPSILQLGTFAFAISV